MFNESNYYKRNSVQQDHSFGLWDYIGHIFMPYSELLKNNYTVKAFNRSIVNDNLY